MEYSPKAEAILALTTASYDEYNIVLPVIKEKIAAWDFIGRKRVETFERMLEKLLPENTARHAFRIAILVAVGEIQEPGKPGSYQAVTKTRRPSSVKKLKR